MAPEQLERGTCAVGMGSLSLSKGLEVIVYTRTGQLLWFRVHFTRSSPGRKVNYTRGLSSWMEFACILRGQAFPKSLFLHAKRMILLKTHVFCTTEPFQKGHFYTRIKLLSGFRMYFYRPSPFRKDNFTRETDSSHQIACILSVQSLPESLFVHAKCMF